MWMKNLVKEKEWLAFLGPLLSVTRSLRGETELNFWKEGQKVEVQKGKGAKKHGCKKAG